MSDMEGRFDGGQKKRATKESAEHKAWWKMEECCAPPSGAAWPSTLGRKGVRDTIPKRKDYIIMARSNIYHWLPY